MINKIKTIKTTTLLTLYISITAFSTLAVSAEGIDQGAFNTWIKSYLDPAFRTLYEAYQKTELSNDEQLTCDDVSETLIAE